MTEHPWTALYPDRVPATMPHQSQSLVEAWRDRVNRSPGATAIAYFDGTLTVRQVDEDSDALAAAFQALGTGRGDRVGIYLQNIPQYALVCLALWKLGATALVLNPMYRGQELRRLIDDAGASGIICTDGDVAETAPMLKGSSVRWMVSTSPLDYQTRDDRRALASSDRFLSAPDGDLVALVERYRDSRPQAVELVPDDVALLTYTSGTTGPPKGAMNTHSNLLSVTSTYAAWIDLSPGDVVFATAPLFHITGAVINATIALLHDTTLVLANRFHPEVAIEAFAEHGVTFTIGSITAFNAIYQLPHASREHFTSMKALYSGGSPIPPATIERFQERFGMYIHNVYGMTETSSAVIGVPLGVEAPIHGSTGTLSIGVPLPNLTARVVDPREPRSHTASRGNSSSAGPR